MRPRRLGSGRMWWRSLAAVAMMAVAGTASADPGGEGLALRLRSRAETPELGGRYRVVETPASWNPKETAIIVCDMWDLHHCLNATRRVKEIAPTMDRVLKAARGRGVLVIHAPSSCTDAYKDHPARKRALETPRSKNLPRDIAQWCNRIPAEEKGTYPIDQSDGGEDDDPAEHRDWAAKLTSMGRNPRAPWKSQIDLLTIDPAADVISDSGEEIWSVFEHRGIKNVILMGVHTNMCVLGRPFGLRQMVKNGKNAVLMRDMTDTMYNPARAPHVNHFTGTDLIVEHVEKFVCPTITSDQLLGGTAFHFAGDKRPLIVMLIAEDEYKTELTLPAFADAHLIKDYRVAYAFGSEKDRNELTGLGALADADVALVSMRRRVLPKAQIEAVRKYVAEGKPVVGIRTASHAFSVLKGPVPEGHVEWKTFDPDVLGGNYHGHHANGVKSTIAEAPGAASHPILKGVDASKLVGNGSLYKVSPIAKSATPLLIGTIPNQPSEPVAWTNIPETKGRVFYTSMGQVDDFTLPDFNRLLRNGIDWATRPESASVTAAPASKGVAR